MEMKLNELCTSMDNPDSGKLRIFWVLRTF
jgi:hypothetical protein